MDNIDRIKAFADKITFKGSNIPNLRINSKIDFYINGKLVKGKTKSTVIMDKGAYGGFYVDVIANSKTYLCCYDVKEEKFNAIIK